MAKKKTPEVVEGCAIEAVTENSETYIMDSEEQTNGFTAETAPTETSQVVIDSPEASEAMAYFKRHPNVDAVYINKLGGVFTKNTCSAFLKGAVLYNNPNLN